MVPTQGGVFTGLFIFTYIITFTLLTVIMLSGGRPISSDDDTDNIQTIQCQCDV